MSFSVFLIIILGVIVVYVCLVNLYTILFQISGLTKEKAHFQVISILTNSGFTTKESEAVTSSKMRRNIAIAAMLTGNIFSIVIVTLFVNLVLSFDTKQLVESFWLILIIFGVFVIIVIILKLPGINKFTQKFLEHLSHKILKDKDRNVVTLLDQYGDDAVCEIMIYGVPSILKDQSLASSRINTKYHINILSIQRGKRTIKVSGDSIVQSGDNILVFGNYLNIRDLFLNEKIIKPEEIASDENVIDIMDNYNDEAIAKVTINKLPECLDHKTIQESHLRDQYQIFVLSIKRDSNFIQAERDTYINIDDELTVFGPYKTIKKIFSNKDDE